MYKIIIIEKRAFRGCTVGNDPECDFYLGPYQLISEIIEHVQGPDFEVDGRSIYSRHTGDHVAEIVED